MDIHHSCCTDKLPFNQHIQILKSQVIDKRIVYYMDFLIYNNSTMQSQ